MRHLVSPEDRRKRAEYLRKLRQEKPEKRGKKGPPKRRKSPRRYRYSVRTDTGPIALQAFWGKHVEAMNWSGLGLAEYAAALGLSPHALRKWRPRPRGIRGRSGLAISVASECAGSIQQRC
ncbi:hypothetical protein NKI48_31785 [Mesorhizobium sp. M0644]|uniref:hypothetical protein n=1 Tax=unclassified Mesorhizobium TaxID=325217 RepID=UPI0012EC5FA3|nr:hypothetical protein [Mesorhizobium sp. LSJC280B00]